MTHKHRPHPKDDNKLNRVVRTGIWWSHDGGHWSFHAQYSGGHEHAGNLLGPQATPLDVLVKALSTHLDVEQLPVGDFQAGKAPHSWVGLHGAAWAAAPEQKITLSGTADVLTGSEADPE